MLTVYVILTQYGAELEISTFCAILKIKLIGYRPNTTNKMKKGGFYMIEYLLYSIQNDEFFEEGIYRWEIYPFEYFSEEDGILIEFKVVYRDTKFMGVIIRKIEDDCYDEDNDENNEIVKMIREGKIIIPTKQKDYYRMFNDVRSRKVTWVKTRGNASKGSISTKLYIPKIWLDVLNADSNERNLEMTFDGDEIRIKKV